MNDEASALGDDDVDCHIMGLGRNLLVEQLEIISDSLTTQTNANYKYIIFNHYPFLHFPQF